MWEHNADSNIWMYVVEGRVVGDVVADGENYEFHIYDEEDNVVLTDNCFSLLKAKKSVERCLAEGQNERDHSRNNRRFVGKYLEGTLLDRKIKRIGEDFGDWLPHGRIVNRDLSRYHEE